MDYKNILQAPEYQFLENMKQKRYVLFLAFGGSISYGTNTPTSDVDIRGCAANTKAELLGMESFESFHDSHTDTVIYSFNRMISLLISCNPNIIELFGCKPEHYLYLSPQGKELLKNKDLFLSQKAIYSFGGFATKQLRQLESILARPEQTQKDEPHINKHIMHLFRIYMMAFDLLERGEICTYRENEHDFLMQIRKGFFLQNGKLLDSFYDALHIYESRFQYDKKHTILPINANLREIQKLMVKINEEVLIYENQCSV